MVNPVAAYIGLRVSVPMQNDALVASLTDETRGCFKRQSGRTCKNRPKEERDQFHVAEADCVRIANRVSYTTKIGLRKIGL
jgi:hypothetical protein